MMGATLDNAVSSSDSARLAEKARHLGSATIGTSASIIPIPEGAAVMRLKAGEVRFFSAKPESYNPHTNGYVPIDEGAKKVQFPGYEPHFRNISYGDPRFYY